MIKKISLGFLAILFLASLFTFFSYSSYRGERLAALESNSQIAETSAGPIEYQLVGDSGLEVLFLHGTPGGYDQSTSIEGYRVLTPSRPGYLRTPIEAGSTPLEQANTYAALLDSLNIDSVVVVGASGGGPSAISFAGTYPERTLGLIAIEAVSQPFALGEAEEQQIPFFLRSDFALWATLSLTERFLGAEGIVDLMVSHPPNRQLILGDAEKVSRMEALMWSIWPISQRSAGQQNDTIQFRTLDLPTEAVTAPTLVIHGTEDSNVPFSQSEMLVEQIPQAIFHVVEGGDHMMPFSHSEQVDAAIEEFLTSLQLDRN